MRDVDLFDDREFAMSAKPASHTLQMKSVRAVSVAVIGNVM